MYDLKLKPEYNKNPIQPFTLTGGVVVIFFSGRASNVPEPLVKELKNLGVLENDATTEHEVITTITVKPTMIEKTPEAVFDVAEFEKAISVTAVQEEEVKPTVVEDAPAFAVPASEEADKKAEELGLAPVEPTVEETETKKRGRKKKE